MSQSGLTPLHLTAQEDKVGAAEVLAKYDANLDQQTKVLTQIQLPTIYPFVFWRRGGSGTRPGCLGTVGREHPGQNDEILELQYIVAPYRLFKRMTG